MAAMPWTVGGPPPNAHYPPQALAQYSRPPQHSRRLPDPIELANRLEEARTSAKLLEQVVASTPPSEVLSNELIKEFADRCSGASRSVQGYMTAENPAPDNDTMESLIDTNEQLQQALNHHHRAVLQAKKHLGVGDSRSSLSNPAPEFRQERRQAQRQSQQLLQDRPLPSAPRRSNGKGKANLDAYESAAIAGPSRSASATPRHDDDDDDDDNEDPFRDPVPEPSGAAAAAASSSRGKQPASADSPPRLSYEPYHPGFGGGGGGSSSAAAAGASGSRGGAGDRSTTPVSDDDRASSVYGATPKKEGHVYRY